MIDIQQDASNYISSAIPTAVESMRRAHEHKLYHLQETIIRSYLENAFLRGVALGIRLAGSSPGQEVDLKAVAAEVRSWDDAAAVPRGPSEDAGGYEYYPPKTRNPLES